MAEKDVLNVLQQELEKLRNYNNNICTYIKQVETLIFQTKNLLFPTTPSTKITQREFLKILCDSLPQQSRGVYNVCYAKNDDLKVIRVKSKTRIFIKIKNKIYYFKESVSKESASSIQISTENYEIRDRLNELEINWSEDSDDDIKRKLDGVWTNNKVRKITQEQVIGTSTNPFAALSFLPQIAAEPPKKQEFDPFAFSLKSDFCHTVFAKNLQSFEWISQYKRQGREAVVALEWDKQLGMLLYSNEPFNPQLHQRVSATCFKAAGVGMQRATEKAKASAEEWRMESRIPVVTIGMTRVKCLVNKEVEKMKREHRESLLVSMAETEVKNDGTMAITSSPEKGVALCLTWKSIKGNKLEDYVLGVPIEIFTRTEEGKMEVACWIAPVQGSSFEKEVSQRNTDKLSVASQAKLFLHENFQLNAKAAGEGAKLFEKMKEAPLHVQDMEWENSNTESDSETIQKGNNDTSMEEKSSTDLIKEFYEVKLTSDELCMCGGEMEIVEAGKTKRSKVQCSMCAKDIASEKHFSCQRSKVKHFCDKVESGCDLCQTCFSEKRESEIIESIPSNGRIGKTVILRNTLHDNLAKGNPLYDTLSSMTKVHLCKDTLSVLRVIKAAKDKRNFVILSNSADSEFFVKTKMIRCCGIPKENILIFTNSPGNSDIKWSRREKVAVETDINKAITFVENSSSLYSSLLSSFINKIK